MFKYNQQWFKVILLSVNMLISCINWLLKLIVSTSDACYELISSHSLSFNQNEIVVIVFKCKERFNQHKTIVIIFVTKQMASKDGIPKVPNWMSLKLEVTR